MANLIKLIPLFKQFQHQQDKSSSQIDRKRHHLKHALAIIPPSSIQSNSSENKYDDIDSEEQPLSVLMIIGT